MTPELTAALEHQRRSLEATDRELARLTDAHRAHLGKADALHLDAWRALGMALVPAVGDALALARTAQLLRLAALKPAAAADAIETRRERLEARQAELRADFDPDDAGPRADALTTRLAELADHAAELRRSVTELERDPDFREYRNHADTARWWTLSYYRAQAAGDRAIARFGARRRVERVDQLVKKHRDEREALATLERELSQLSAEQRRLRERASELAQVEHDLTRLEELVADDLRRVVVDNAQGLPEKALLELLADVADARAAAHAIAGTRALRRYLSACFAHWVERPRAELRSHLQDVALVLGGRGQRRGPGDTPGEVDAETTRRQRELEQGGDRYRSTAERLLAFDAWTRCDPLAGDLWWDHLSGGLIDGSFIDEVAWHRTMQRAPSGRLTGGGYDKRDNWSTNAESASERLAAAAAAWTEQDDDDG